MLDLPKVSPDNPLPMNFTNGVTTLATVPTNSIAVKAGPTSFGCKESMFQIVRPDASSHVRTYLTMLTCQTSRLEATKLKSNVVEAGQFDDFQSTF